MSSRAHRGFWSKPLTIAIALMLALFAIAAVGCGDDDEEAGGSGGGASQNASGGEAKEKVKIGVSNTLVGNGWREEMICSVKAQAAASGQVSEVLVHNVNGAAPEQIAGIRN